MLPSGVRAQRLTLSVAIHRLAASAWEVREASGTAGHVFGKAGRWCQRRTVEQRPSYGLRPGQVLLSAVAWGPVEGSAKAGLASAWPLGHAPLPRRQDSPYGRVGVA
ncbi:hypothetical protein GCM10023220_00730 [Streptomyces ziwulingensis]|uniref:Uncharacterized protein n=1 Tax=Streptomyces ziwulingensis TaxID=1045501 RepID=A0ABP9AL00_9ACTN